MDKLADALGQIRDSLARIEGRLEGLRQMHAAFSKAERDTRLGVRRTLRKVAEPVQRTAEQLAASSNLIEAGGSDDQAHQ